MIVSAGRGESFDFAYPIGVGLVESTINLTRLALFDRPEFLLFIGSAGSYGDYTPFDIVTSKGAVNIELSFFEGRSYTPLDNAIVSEGFNVSHETLVNSSNYITTDKKSWKKFRSVNVGIENMEFFSVLSVAREFNIPAAGVFVITNFCDENAHEQYRKNISEAMERLRKYIKDRFLREKS